MCIWFTVECTYPLSVPVSLCLCLFLSLCVCLSVCLSVSVCLSLSVSDCLSVLAYVVDWAQSTNQPTNQLTVFLSFSVSENISLSLAGCAFHRRIRGTVSLALLELSLLRVAECLKGTRSPVITWRWCRPAGCGQTAINSKGQVRRQPGNASSPHLNLPLTQIPVFLSPSEHGSQTEGVVCIHIQTLCRYSGWSAPPAVSTACAFITEVASTRMERNVSDNSVDGN